MIFEDVAAINRAGKFIAYTWCKCGEVILNFARNPVCPRCGFKPEEMHLNIKD